MSSSVVRTLVEQWLEDPAMAVKYYATINEDQDPDDAMWCTAKFSPSYRESTTFCGGKTTEEGEVEIIYFGQPGIGESALIVAVETDMLVLMAQRDPAGDMVILNRSAPFEFSGGSAGSLYGLSIFLEYQYYE